MKKFEFIASKGDLQNQITKNCTFLSYNDIKTIFRKKDVIINGLRTKQTVFLSGNEIVTIYYQEKKTPNVPIIYEDDNILIVNKPVNMECTICDKVYLNSPCLEDVFAPYFCVHRLDMNTSGLIIMAKNEKVKQEFITLFKENSVHKNYTAICYGNFTTKQNTLISYAKKVKGTTKIYSQKQPNSVQIKTYYEVMSTNNNLSLVSIKLFTGYTHQIRAHLSSIGCFVLGDDKYGKKDINNIYKTHRQQLCATSLSFSIKQQSFLSYLNNKSFSISPPFTLSQFTN